MAIVVEDGTIVSGANSYVSEAELTTYATARGVTLTGDTEELLIKAMDYVEQLSFKGFKRLSTQPLQFPRANLVIDDYLIDLDVIPTILKEGLMEVAMSIDNGEDPLADVTRVKQSATVGPISVTYAQGGSSTTLVRKIHNKLKKLISSTPLSFDVVRA